MKDTIVLVGSPDPVKGSVQRKCKDCEAFVWLQPANVKAVEAQKGYFMCVECAFKRSGPGMFNNYMEQGKMVTDPTEQQVQELFQEISTRTGETFTKEEMDFVITELMHLKRPR